MLEYAHLNAEGRPTLDLNGEYHRNTRRYDDQGRLVESDFFALDSKPATSEGVHRETTRHGPAGESETAYFGPGGKAVLNSEGYHRRVQRPAATKKSESTSLFRTDGKPVLHVGGYHKAVYDLDDQARRTEVRYLDLTDKPVQTQHGYARLQFIYRSGAHVDTNAFNLDDKPVPIVAVVRSVKIGSGAEGVKLRKGDRLLSYRGRKVSSAAWFVSTQSAEGKDAEAGELLVQRDGKEIKFEVKPGPLGLELLDVAESVAMRKK